MIATVEWKRANSVAQAERPWIRVSDQLPREGLIVTTNSGDGSTGGFQNLARLGNKWYFADGAHAGPFAPTFWRHLPGPARYAPIRWVSQHLRCSDCGSRKLSWIPEPASPVAANSPKDAGVEVPRAATSDCCDERVRIQSAEPETDVDSQRAPIVSGRGWIILRDDNAAHNFVARLVACRRCLQPFGFHVPIAIEDPDGDGRKVLVAHLSCVIAEEQKKLRADCAKTHHLLLDSNGNQWKGNGEGKCRCGERTDADFAPHIELAGVSAEAAICARSGCDRKATLGSFCCVMHRDGFSWHAQVCEEPEAERAYRDRIYVTSVLAHALSDANEVPSSPPSDSGTPEKEASGVQPAKWSSSLNGEGAILHLMERVKDDWWVSPCGFASAKCPQNIIGTLCRSCADMLLTRWRGASIRIASLEKQVTELQAANTREVERRRTAEMKADTTENLLLDAPSISNRERELRLRSERAFDLFVESVHRLVQAAREVRA